MTFFIILLIVLCVFIFLKYRKYKLLSTNLQHDLQVWRPTLFCFRNIINALIKSYLIADVFNETDTRKLSDIILKKCPNADQRILFSYLRWQRAIASDFRGYLLKHVGEQIYCNRLIGDNNYNEFYNEEILDLTVDYYESNEYLAIRAQIKYKPENHDDYTETETLFELPVDILDVYMNTPAFGVGSDENLNDFVPKFLQQRFGWKEEDCKTYAIQFQHESGVVVII